MIVRVTEAELPAAAELACRLWPDHRPAELEAEFSRLLRGGDGALFLLREEGRDAGFAQCSLRRDYVEGTGTSPVGYLEGVFVREDCRRRGFARALLAACQNWARERGCAEFASDCGLDNEDSRRFHLNTGFAEAARIICFAKKL